ncbi:hypothetical protein CU098_007226 [Rhizopus stolonifer]|uniref:Methyltransferase domain-containing protein n=1 Tax=Rhizopus stolonifer TaxID=4846 RepID=A0A367K8Q0_RHIST|nr:hypothetical protein CU098_007226 [Rhizopus stolonifer]
MSNTIIHLKITISEEFNNQRIRKFLLQHYRDIIQSKENLHRSFGRKEILVNGTPVEETRFLKTGDFVEVKYNKSIEESEKMNAIPVRVCYEDKHLAVVWKPSGQNFIMFEKAIQFKMALKGLQEEKVWCINDIQKAASGLIIVAKTKQAHQSLVEQYKQDKIDVIMRVLCHGSVATTDIPSLFSLRKDHHTTEHIVPKEIVKSIHIISQTPSNNAQFITRLDLSLHTPLSSTQLRKLFYFYSPNPIIGNSEFTYPLKVNKDKGLCASLLSVSFMHPILQTQVNIAEQEPAKFNVVCDREARFYQKKLDREQEQLKKANMDPKERKEGQLLAYVLGHKEFCGHTFKITQDCLIPRPSSETLVHATLHALHPCPDHARIIDIGTGSGNLLISILKELPSSVTGVGIDISQAALSIARENSKSLLMDESRATWRVQDMNTLSEFKEVFDVLVCNPPYLVETKSVKKRGELNTFEHEPPEALFAKEDGYEWYYSLRRLAPMILKKDGYVVLECGKGMMRKVSGIWCQEGWQQHATYKDPQGWDRCLVLKKS